MERTDQNIPNEWLACPVSKEALVEREGRLESSAGKYGRDPQHGYWNFVPKVEGPKWKSWDTLQANGMVGYEADPIANIAVGKIPEYVAFGKFCEFRGRVLDIGVGPQKSPTHFEDNDRPGVTFVGVDPLVGEQPRDFKFVLALGEYLPFKDGVFDQVLFVTSLDHFIDPRDALREAIRVMKDDGDLLIFHGDKDKDAPRPAVSPQWYQNLVVPPGAEDPFHMRRFNHKELEGYFDELGLVIAKVQKREVDKWRREFFYKVQKKAKA